MRQRRPLVFLAVFLISLFVVLGILIGIYTEWLWFKEVGFTSVYLKVLLVKAILAVITGGVFFVFLFANVLLARKLSPQWMVSFQDQTLEQARSLFSRFAYFISAGVSLFFALVVGLSASSDWELVLKFLNQTSFHLKDPFFNQDISFYIFSLPFYRYLYSYVMGLLILATVIVFVVYLFSGAIVIRRKAERFNLKLAAEVRAHLSSLLGFVFVVKALDYVLSCFELMYSRRGAAFGATYTDIYAQLPALKLLTLVALLCALLFFLNTYFKNIKLPLISFGALLVVSFLGGSVYPALVQRYSVEPNEISRERKFIKHNIEFTRRSYGLDKVKEIPFTAEGNLTIGDIQRNQATMKNVRLWDWRPLRSTYSQLQEIRLYYTFPDVDVDRYRFDGEYREVLLSPRELSSDKLPEKTWINEHLVFTHGYGLCLSPVSEVTADGLPHFLIKDIPPVSSTSLKVNSPAVYFGEETKSYAVVNSKQKEFDYAKGERNQYTRYRGSGGVELSSTLKKALFAWKFSSLQLLLSDAITPQSRVMWRRTVNERINTIAPFLSYDNDPYLVISKDGKLYWMVDGYTTSDMYPYSKPIEGSNTNYIRNSFKVVIDAYNGKVTYYTVDDKDPLIKTYARIFPHLFKPFKAMPDDLKQHIRYPLDLFKIQSQMYTTYHMRDPQVFYNREDLWAVSNEVFEGGEQPVEPYYVIMKLPGEPVEQFMLMLPFTPVNKNNMIAWMSAKCDLKEYGNLLVYNFPKQRLIYGPMQIEARIDQDPEISKLLSLWSQKGSQVIRGNLLVIPIEKSLLYVEPLYLRAEQGQLPELKRVTVAYGGKIAMEENLDRALQAVFGSATTETPKGKRNLSDLVGEAVDHFNKAKNAQKQGDWATYGEELQKLDEVLRQLQTSTKGK